MNEQTIFSEALERTDPQERDAFLSQACQGDPALRRRIDRLLAVHEHAASFLEEPVAPAIPDHGPTPDPSHERLGTKIGPYKLIEQIGEGGMGTVWMAQQSEPVKRLVALKVIKPGMDSRQIIARFDAERQALALMDHPNIARVLDGGTTSAGRPFFVMDLVRGTPITQYCDEHHLTPRQRLELFMPVCQAVQHAHQKGIIHRDLKPSNVLVALYDDRPVPKVIDFGVAKAVGQPLTEQTLVTGFGNIVGTLEYMSPEQAEVNQLDIDTRSDIYSLGVLLYELLTGSPPFTRKELTQAGMLEMLRVIREQEPSKPSTKLSTAQGLPTLAANRGTEPAKLARLVRGELDWIVMKALEKDRNRRYETANGFAMDVQRYLADEPVFACPPSARYRLRKFARRNRAALLTAGLVAASLLTGTGIIIWQAVRAWEAQALAQKHLAAETAAREQAIREGTKATVISNLLQQTLSSANPHLAKGADYTVRQLLDDFSRGLRDQFQGQPEVEAAVLAAIGNAYSRLGLFHDAEPHLLKALELRRQLLGPEHLDVAQSLVDHSWNAFESGNFQLAEAEAREALDICQRADAEQERVFTAMMLLSWYLGLQGENAEAEVIGDRALALAKEAGLSDHPDLAKLLHDLALVKLTTGNPAAAEQLGRDSVAMHRRVNGNDHPETAWALFNLGRVLTSQSKHAESETTLREALTAFRKQYDESHKSIVMTSESLERVLTSRGDQVGLVELRADKVARLNMTLNLQKINLTIASAAASQCVQLGHSQLDKGDLAAAEPAFELAIQLLQSVLEKIPDDAENQNRLAGALAYRGVVQERLQRPEQAVASLSQAIGLWRQLSERDPDNEWYRQERAHFSLGVANLLRAAGQLDQALEHCRTSVLVNEKLVADFPEQRVHLDRLRNAQGILIEILSSLGRDEEAAEVAQKTDDPYLLGYCYAQLGQWEQAAAEFAKAAERKTDDPLPRYREALIRVRLRDVVRYRAVCADMLRQLAVTPDANRSHWTVWTCVLAPAAVTDWQPVVELAEKPLAADPKDFDKLVHMGAVLYRAGRFEEAAGHLREAERAFAHNPRSSVTYGRLFLAMTEYRLGRSDKAKEWHEKSIQDIDQPPQDSAARSWNRQLTLQLLKREAEELFNQHK